MALRVLWGSPLPPVRSGVSDYALEVLPVLARRARVRLLTPPGWVPQPWPLADTLSLVSATTPAEPDELCLVHLGNNPYHEWLLDRLQAPGAVVVLHDLVLHHLLIESTLGRGPRFREEYEARLTAAHGPAGAALARARRYGMAGRRDPFLFPARRAFLAQARAVIVHSEWAREQVLKDLPELPTYRINLVASDPGEVDRAALRRHLGLAPSTVVLMHLGFLTPAKGMFEILTAVAAARNCGAEVHLVLVGEGELLGPLSSATAALGLTESVTTTGWVAAQDLLRLPAAADLGVVLRTPSAGETSAAVLRFLACATPVAVGGLRQFLEWPEQAAPRLTPGPAAAAELTRLIMHAADGGLERSRAAARQAYEQGHRIADGVEALIKVLTAVKADPAPPG